MGMSEKNVETVRLVYEGVSARLEVPRELFDPDYEFDNTELWPDIGEVLGFQAAQEAMREYWETFEAYHVEIEEVIHADDGRVVNVVRDGGRMRGTPKCGTASSTSGPFVMGGSFASRYTPTGTDPSKPLGCRSSAEVLLWTKATAPRDR
jgi:SnoaL-like domain